MCTTPDGNSKDAEVVEQESLTEERNEKKVYTDIWAFKSAAFKIAI